MENKPIGLSQGNWGYTRPPSLVAGNLEVPLDSDTFQSGKARSTTPGDVVDFVRTQGDKGRNWTLHLPAESADQVTPEQRTALKDAGVPVEIDPPGTVRHTKYPILDDDGSPFLVGGGRPWASLNLSDNPLAPPIVGGSNLADEYFIGSWNFNPRSNLSE